ncbi:hypothetical protein [Corynebacterium senegalense]|uniref:hypothetical protein n=1 Tax=Corynebacterium senegalense TaxID=2080750 RepID=UPI000E2099B1|nr:hypothetical protein [Corynebacterium senegalense]
MYYPVPGHRHIKVLVQPRPDPPFNPRPAPRPQPRPAARPSPLLLVALDAAFGMRDAAALRHASYAAGVRGHINARRRANAPAGPVRVLTCHAREGGEFFGTVQAGGRRFAYAARVADGRLVSFKVL